MRGIDQFTAEDEELRPRAADDRHQFGGSRLTDPTFDESEARVVAGDDQVALRDQPHSRAQAQSVHCGDYRLSHLTYRRVEVVELADEAEVVVRRNRLWRAGQI